MTRLALHFISAVVVVVGLDGGRLLLTPQADQAMLFGEIVVRDRAGRPVGNLGPEAFSVSVNGRPAAWHFEPQRPLDIVMLLDYSASLLGGSNIQGQYSSDSSREYSGQCYSVVTIDGWMNAISGLLGSGDRVRLASFGSVGKVGPFRSSAPELLASVSDIRQQDGPSPLWDSVYSVADLFERNRRRPVVFLVTDGLATANHHSFDEAVASAVRSPVTIYTTADRCAMDGVEDDTALAPRRSLGELAAATGGRLFETGKGERPTEVGSRIRDDLSRHYAMAVVVNGDTTSPPAVTVSRSNATVVARWSR